MAESDRGAIDAVTTGGTRPTSARRPFAITRHKFGVAVAVCFLVAVCLLALLAPLLPLDDPKVLTGGIAEGPSGDHLYGTDQLGRDVLSRVIWGGRVSIIVAAISTSVAMVIGLLLGTAAGYFRGWLDTIVVGFVDLLLAFPTLILLLTIVAVRGPTTSNLIIGMMVILISGFTRLTRASTIAFADREFVRAARGLGASNARILRRDLLPNVLPPVSAYALSAAAHVFIVEGSLSFLGVGVPPPTPSWGAMIQAGRPMFEKAPHVVVAPALTMLLTVVAFNSLGDHLRHGKPSSEAMKL